MIHVTLTQEMVDTVETVINVGAYSLIAATVYAIVRKVVTS